MIQKLTKKQIKHFNKKFPKTPIRYIRVDMSKRIDIYYKEIDVKKKEPFTKIVKTDGKVEVIPFYNWHNEGDHTERYKAILYFLGYKKEDVDRIVKNMNQYSCLEING